MQVTAIDSDEVLCRIRAAGLSSKQAQKLLNRTLLALHHIGQSGRRVSVEVFQCFSGQVRCGGHRLRFSQVLREAKLIKQTKPALSGFCSAEYQCEGKAIQQEIKLTRAEAQIMRKIQAANRKKVNADKTLRWLCEALQHVYADGAYQRLGKPPKWPTASLQRAFAGIVTEAIKKDFRARYFRKLVAGLSVSLGNGDNSNIGYRAGLEADFFQIASLARFADRLHGEPCTAEDLEKIDFRVALKLKSKGFQQTFRPLLIKEIIEKTVEHLKKSKVLCAVDTQDIHAENPEALEAAFVAACKDCLDVDVTQRDKPVLSPLYIDRLRRLYATKHGIKLAEVPRVRARYWQPKTETTEDGRTLFNRRPFGRGETRLDTVQEAKDFYGIDPEALEAEKVTLYEARRQIEESGSVKASNAQDIYRELEDLGHALPIEPTRQQWELTGKGRACLLASQPKAPALQEALKVKSTARPVQERLTA